MTAEHREYRHLKFLITHRLGEFGNVLGPGAVIVEASAQCAQLCVSAHILLERILGNLIRRVAEIMKEPAEVDLFATLHQGFGQFRD